MSSRDDLARFIQIIRRDGSHTSHHQQIAFGYLFHYIQPGGMYIIEDLHWQDERKEINDAPKTRDILRRFQLDGSMGSPFFTLDEQTYIPENVKKVYLFDSAHEVDDPTDALGVIVKKGPAHTERRVDR
jgi:hypothetical protein